MQNIYVTNMKIWKTDFLKLRKFKGKTGLAFTMDTSIQIIESFINCNYILNERMIFDLQYRVNGYGY